MNRKISIALIGYGRLGSIHAKNIVASEKAELHAICDTNTEALEHAKSQYGVETFTVLDDFLKRPIDAVVIASSTPQHLAHIQAVANKGLAIFTEKPVGLTLEQTDEVLRTVVKANIPFQIGFQRRWDPRYMKAKQIIKSGEIGQPVLLKAYGRDPNASNPLNWGLDKNGGLFLNAAIHDYDAARYLLDSEIEGISASGGALVYPDLAKVGDIDTCTTTLFMKDKAMAVTEWSRFATYGYDVGFEIVGTQGMLRIGREQNSQIAVYHKDNKAPSVFDVFADAYRAEIEGFIDTLMQERAPTPGVEDARIALYLALSARHSFENNSRYISLVSLATLSSSAAGLPLEHHLQNR
jgi:predicted dehydrogenase